MRSLLFWDVTQCTLAVIDVSGQPVDPIFKGRAGQEDLECLTLQKNEDLMAA